MKYLGILCIFFVIGSLGIGSPSLKKANEYMDWVKGKGFSDDSVYIGLDPTRGGYGVFSSKDIFKEQIILKIPPSLVINRMSIISMIQELSEDGRDEKEFISYFNDAIVELDIRSNHSNNDAHLLSFLILYQRCFPDRLNYMPWINILPDTIDNLIHFEEDELEYLRGSELYERTKLLREKTFVFWENHVQEIVNELFDKEGLSSDDERRNSCFTFSNWKWAMSIVSSRSSFVPKQGLSIVLISEMINHQTTSEKRRPHRYIEDNGDFVIVSKQIYPKGSQIFVDYHQPNSELLLLYGFRDERCQVDNVGLPIGLDPNDKYYDEKVSILENNGWPSSLWFPLALQPSREFLFYMRLFAAENDELDIIRENTEDYFDRRVNDRNELAACGLMERIAAGFLGKYPYQDLHPEQEEILRNSLSHRANMAFSIAKTERRILKSIIDYSQSLFPSEELLESLKEIHGDLFHQEVEFHDEEMIL